MGRAKRIFIRGDGEGQAKRIFIRREGEGQAKRIFIRGDGEGQGYGVSPDRSRATGPQMLQDRSGYGACDHPPLAQDAPMMNKSRKERP